MGFNTLCAERARAPRNARVFFEGVIERCVGGVQLGWIGTVVRCDQESGDGVGDDGVSWGVDGIRLKKWAGGDTPYRTARKWRDGDVIGCAADMARGDLSFALNGVWSGPDGVAFRGDAEFRAATARASASWRFLALAAAAAAGDVGALSLIHI